MDIPTLTGRLWALLRGFRDANAANVTVMFALGSIPMVGFVGAAVDYSRANKIKASMQAAADSTALMLSKNASSLSSTQLTQKANEYFSALFTGSDAGGLAVSATYSNSGGSQVTVNASATVKANFMKLMGFNDLKVGVDSQVKWGNTKMRVALALDNTGSMNDDGKMAALKTATNKLLDQLQAAAATNGDVLFSIIPFSKAVNVGKGNVNATWIDWTAWDAANGGSGGGMSGSICINGTLWVVSGSSFTNGGTCSKPSSGICYNGTLYNWSGSSFTTSGTCTNHSTWNGCVTDRGLSTQPHSLNYDTNVSPPTAAVTASLFPADQDPDCPTQVKPLSYDWTAMKTLVAAMDPGGLTNQAIGLVHGWMSLVGGGPYPTPPAEDPNYKYSKVIILMSDGLNTRNRWYTNQNQIDGRQKMTCDNVKAAGITLYTVHVNTGGDPLSTLLQQCASSPDKFFHLTTASQMVATFEKIGVALSNLRISQ